MKARALPLCSCGHPIIVLSHEHREGKPDPDQCACCRTGVRFGPKRPAKDGQDRPEPQP